MLRELRIRNFAVIAEVSVPFTPGLNVLSGETGTGKSMVIDALLLVRGGRAQTDVIRSDAESASVEAVFEVDPHGGVAAVLEEAGLAHEEGLLVIRRELARSGRHRAFANDSPVTVGLLERLGDQLVELHGQHEHQRLLEPSAQLELLDRFAEAEPLRERVGELFAKHRAARAEIDRTRETERDRAQREDLLRFQVSELDAARLRPGEEEELRAERRRLQHAERLTAALTEAGALLDEDRDSALSRLDRVARLLQEIVRVDPAGTAPLEALEAARAHLDDVRAGVRSLRDGIGAEPGRLEAIDDRLDALTRLKRKYGDSEDAMLAFRAEAARELERLERHEELLAGQERLLTELEAELAAAAAALGGRRREGAARLGAQAQRELRTLGMERAVFEVAVEGLPLDAISARGQDRVELRLSTNPGEEVKPLSRVASGGELSRTMLALKAVLARADRVPTLVFDEIDAGIGGGVAGVVADKLAAAAQGRQVLCVTHLAPIAARAGHHVRVTKRVRGGRTGVSAEALEGEERVAEIARMLGGDPGSETARRHARELLGARRGRPGRPV